MEYRDKKVTVKLTASELEQLEQFGENQYKRYPFHETKSETLRRLIREEKQRQKEKLKIFTEREEQKNNNLENEETVKRVVAEFLMEIVDNNKENIKDKIVKYFITNYLPIDNRQHSLSKNIDTLIFNKIHLEYLYKNKKLREHWELLSKDLKS